ncbi:MAG: DegT/DnrJ/EryC1/StrS family aminotransferase [Lentisphaeria bacterium]|nr:DegT/DnrJ/EryC1/StrS family aminotransferase [Lentisphaeria bacterium]
MLPFIDLKYQYSLIRDEIHAGIDRVLESGHYILGAEIAELEKQLAEYAGVKHALACSSGTDALLMALMALGIGPGDAVFTTPFTFFATVETIALVGATPVFADIDEATYNIDPAKLEEAILKVEREGKLKPKAVIPVDLFGLTADYKAIKPLADAHGLAIIEDACQAFGAVDPSGKRAPSLGTIGCTSFFPAKPLGCYGDGGAVFTDDDDLYDKLYSILVHGRSAEDRYNNVRLGLNARCDTIQAAVLLAKLKLFPGEVEMRQAVADRYRAGLKGLVSVQAIPEGCVSVYAQFCPRSPKFAEIQAALKAADVPTARYYPIPMHLLGATEYLGYKKGDMPVSEACAADIFALPMHPYLKNEDIDRICGVIADTVKA